MNTDLAKEEIKCSISGFLKKSACYQVVPESGKIFKTENNYFNFIRKVVVFDEMIPLRFV